MIQVDLITGFLGSGKTTFLIDYAKYLVKRGEKVAVIVNDHGAINVDRLLLDESLSDKCRIEMVIGGDNDCRRRRLKTKLIAMGMGGYDRVLLEPSGVFDVDEFFDMLFEEPLKRWYRIGNVLAIVEEGVDRNLSYEAKYLLASQAAKAGKIVVSKVSNADESFAKDDIKEIDKNVEDKYIQGEQSEILHYLNDAMGSFQCRRKLAEKNLFYWRLGEISDEDYEMLSHSGYNSGEMIKLPIDETEAFDSLFFFHVRVEDTSELKPLIESLIQDKENGNIIRLKGFIRKNQDNPNSSWLEVNATKTEVTVKPIPVGQELFIVIGEGLNQEHISKYWKSYRNEVV